MGKFIWAMAAGLVLCLPHLASAQARVGIVLGADLARGQWVAARKQQRAQYFENYLVGLVDGLALGRAVDIWSAGGSKVSGEQVFLWMDRYCETRPLDMVATGAFAFAEERTSGEFGGALKPR